MIRNKLITYILLAFLIGILTGFLLFKYKSDPIYSLFYVVQNTLKSSIFGDKIKLKIINAEKIRTQLITFNREVIDLGRDDSSRGPLICSSDLGNVFALKSNLDLFQFDINLNDYNKSNIKTLLQDKFQIHELTSGNGNFVVNSLVCNDLITNDNLGNLIFSLSTKDESGNTPVFKSYIFSIYLTNRKIIKIKKIFYSDNLSNLNVAGRIVIADQENLYFSSSSIDGDEEKLEKNPNHLNIDSMRDDTISGKIIKINTTTGLYTLVSKGHRNPAGLFLDHLGRLFSTEHGPRGGDELNLIKNGRNYGWPLTSYGLPYRITKSLYGVAGRHSESFELPLFAWTPSIAISQGIFQPKHIWSEWDGDLIISSLKNASLYRVRFDNSGIKVMLVESIFIGERIRDVAYSRTKMIISTDNNNLIILKKAEPDTNNTNYLDIREKILGQCLTCHHYAITNDTNVAPTFRKLLSRRVASDSNFNYSNPMSKLSGKWDKQRFIEYVSNPQLSLPGTMMHYSTTKLEAAKIYDFLVDVENSPID